MNYEDFQERLEAIKAAVKRATKSIKLENEKIKEFESKTLNEKIHEVYFMDKKDSFISKFLDFRIPDHLLETDPKVIRATLGRNERYNSSELANEALILAKSTLEELRKPENNKFTGRSDAIRELEEQIEMANNLVQQAINSAGQRSKIVEDIKGMSEDPKYLGIYTFLDERMKSYSKKTQATENKTIFTKFKEYKNLNPDVQSAMVESLRHNISKYQSKNADEKAGALDAILLELYSNQQRHAEKKATGLGSFNFGFMKALPNSLKRDLCQRLDLDPNNFTKSQLRDALTNEFNPDNLPRSRNS